MNCIFTHITEKRYLLHGQGMSQHQVFKELIH